MIVFWLICAGLLIVALLFILPPLLQPEVTDHTGEVREANLAVYRDQLRELEADLSNGIVGKAQYDQDREEIERRLLADIEVAKPTTASKKIASLSSRPLVYALALAMPTAAVLMYLKVGTRQALSASATTTSSASTAGRPGEMTQERIEANVAALEKRLEQNPNDGPGWSMLARSYTTMQRYKEASSAFEKATSIVTNDADLLTEYAFALSMARGQDWQGKPAELLAKALEIDPKNLKTLVFAGNAAFKTGNYNQAVEYWRKFYRHSLSNSEVESLSAKISEAKRLAKTTPNK